MARGDQVYVLREFFNLDGLYQHHGIDCGDGSIIHYRKPKEMIERTSLAVFSKGNPIYLRHYSLEFCFIPDVVIDRAHSRLGEQKYNLLFNNCEHFATWCKTGISDSKQVREFLPSLNKINVQSLDEPLKRAVQDALDQRNTQQILNEALDDIRVVWDRIQPEYCHALDEMNTWEEVAKRALQKNREDLAREAIKRKLNYKQKATNLKIQLDQLATMTETLIRNSTR